VSERPFAQPEDDCPAIDGPEEECSCFDCVAERQEFTCLACGLTGRGCECE
jgi:hypothetical protein